MRATHNLFLKKKITINNLTANLGSGVKNDYLSLITKNKNLVQNFDFFKKESKTVTLDLEKKFNLNEDNKDYVSQSLIKGLFSENHDNVETTTLKDIMAENDHLHIDILKYL